MWTRVRRPDTPATGKIPPGQSASIVVRYEPKNLGAHVEHLTVTALATDGTPMHESAIAVHGVCHVTGDKPTTLPGRALHASSSSAQLKLNLDHC